MRNNNGANDPGVLPGVCNYACLMAHLMIRSRQVLRKASPARLPRLRAHFQGIGFFPPGVGLGGVSGGAPIGRLIRVYKSSPLVFCQHHRCRLWQVRRKLFLPHSRTASVCLLRQVFAGQNFWREDDDHT